MKKEFLMWIIVSPFIIVQLSNQKLNIFHI